jgi:hypothetical protein
MSFCLAEKRSKTPTPALLQPSPLRHREPLGPNADAATALPAATATASATRERTRRGEAKPKSSAAPAALLLLLLCCSRRPANTAYLPILAMP